MSHTRGQFVPETVSRQCIIMYGAKLHVGAHTHVQMSTMKMVRQKLLKSQIKIIMFVSIDRTYHQMHLMLKL
jgi:hypothetical protein